MCQLIFSPLCLVRLHLLKPDKVRTYFRIELRTGHASARHFYIRPIPGLERKSSMISLRYGYLAFIVKVTSMTIAATLSLSALNPQLFPPLKSIRPCTLLNCRSQMLDFSGSLKFTALFLQSCVISSAYAFPSLD